MTDPTATANGNDTATTADNEPAPPDAAALAKEAADYKDKLLRGLADMENLRRRTDREVADARAYEVSGLARDLIGVADNFHRALEAASQSTAPSPSHPGTKMHNPRGPLVGLSDDDHTDEGTRAEPHPRNELQWGLRKGLLRLCLQLVCGEGAAAKPQHFAIAVDDAHILHVAQPG